MTNYHIGPHRTTSDHIWPNLTKLSNVCFGHALEHVSGAWAAKKAAPSPAPRPPAPSPAPRSPLRSDSATSRSTVFLQLLLTALLHYPISACSAIRSDSKLTSEYPVLTVGKSITQFIVKMCNAFEITISRV